MSKFQLSQELTKLVSDAVQAFALRLESECKINKERILEIWNTCSEDIATVKQKTPKGAVKPTKQVSAAVEEKKVQTIAKLPERRFALRKNAFGNYEHKETSFLFDPSTKDVFGKQVGDKVVALTMNDMDICKQLGFKFRIPETFTDEAGQESEDAVSDIEPEDDEEEEDE
jgi:hypothetical protein